MTVSRSMTIRALPPRSNSTLATLASLCTTRRGIRCACSGATSCGASSRRASAAAIVFPRLLDPAHRVLPDRCFQRRQPARASCESRGWSRPGCPHSHPPWQLANAPNARAVSRAAWMSRATPALTRPGGHEPAAPQLAIRVDHPGRPIRRPQQRWQVDTRPAVARGIEHQLDVAHHLERFGEHVRVDLLQQPSGRGSAVRDEERAIDVPACRDGQPRVDGRKPPSARLRPRCPPVVHGQSGEG